MNISIISLGMYIPQRILQADYYLFSRMNGRWHNSFFDAAMPFIREPFVWMPFYLFLVFFTTINFKTKGWLWVLFLLINVALSDYVSSTIIKGNFERLRPCRNPAFSESIRFLVSYCPESSSFTSSHAVNHFAAAMFIFTTFKKTISYHWAWLFLWAFAIAYAQVYVGVHFPLDVFCGTIAGLVLGYIPAKIFNARVGLRLNEIQKV